MSLTPSPALLILRGSNRVKGGIEGCIVVGNQAIGFQGHCERRGRRPQPRGAVVTNGTRGRIERPQVRLNLRGKPGVAYAFAGRDRPQQHT